MISSSTVWNFISAKRRLSGWVIRKIFGVYRRLGKHCSCTHLRKIRASRLVCQWSFAVSWSRRFDGFFITACILMCKDLQLLSNLCFGHDLVLVCQQSEHASIFGGPKGVKTNILVHIEGSQGADSGQEAVGRLRHQNQNHFLHMGHRLVPDCANPVQDSCACFWAQRQQFCPLGSVKWRY